MGVSNGTIRDFAKVALCAPPHAPSPAPRAISIPTRSNFLAQCASVAGCTIESAL